MANRDYSSEIDALKGDVTALRDDIAKLVGALGEDVEQRGDAAREAATERLEKLRKQGRDSLDQVEGSIERNPLTALATALGIGFLIGALLGRR